MEELNKALARLEKAIADIGPSSKASKGQVVMAPRRSGGISARERGSGLVIRRAGKMKGKKIRPKKDPQRLLETRRRNLLRQQQSMSAASPHRKVGK